MTPRCWSPFRTLAALALAAVAFDAAALAPPAPAPVRPVTDTYFGVEVKDPYRYMENMGDPEVVAWMKAQADYTRATLDALPGRKALYGRIEQLGDAASARVFDVQRVGDRVYYQKRLANENIPKLYVRDGTSGKERLLVDPEREKAPQGKHFSLDYYAPSPDNRYVAYGISPAGSEDSVLRVVDVATARDTGDVIDRAQYASPSWLPAPDGRHRLMYSRLQLLAPGAPVTDRYQNQRTFVHVLGDDPAKDVAIFGAGVSSVARVDPVELVVVTLPPGADHVVALAINGVQREMRMWTAPVAALDGARTPWKKAVDTDDAVTDFTVAGPHLYLMTHKDAPRFKVLRTSLAQPDVAKASVAIPASESVVTGVVAGRDALYARRMAGGLSEVIRLPHDGGRAAAIPMPFAGDVDAMAADPRVAGVLFSAGAWTRFGGIFAYDPARGRTVDTRLQPQGPFDNPPDLVAEEVKVRAADGTLVPLSIVHRKGLKRDGRNPTILYGYGAYGISMTPFYRPQYLAWFERGGVLAVAHVRGGGEYGDDWHKAGQKLTKPNTWRDAIACAEWLVANGYASREKLAIEGGSAGGIFVGRAVTERPDLFAAAVNQVPVSDVVRGEFSANGVPNIPEFGTVKTEEGFKGLYAMSPYHWVKDGEKYPAMLLTTGINDPRVDAYQAGKMAARLQAASTSGKPILLRIDYDAGHGFGSTKKQRYEELADTFAFLLWQFGHPDFQPATTAQRSTVNAQ